MVKIKILNSGSVKEVEDKTVCWDLGRRLMRIVDVAVGDHVLLTKADRTKDEVAEVLEKFEVEDR